ncbi:MAG: hypothetical protein IJG68_02565 [Bacilli bacterium]|nr:hypothetical protein [Bacilli bacterium]
MEKIYMQDSEQSSSSSRSSSSSSSQSSQGMFRFSIVLSFLVAVFAMVSLIAVGFNNISFAASSIEGNSFTFYEGVQGSGNPIMIRASDNGSGGFFTVPIYLANNADYINYNAVPVFCVEHNTNIQDGATYNKGDSIDDIGLLYILNKSRVLGGSGITPEDLEFTIGGQAPTSRTYGANIIETYATQVAIWVYMYEKYYLSNPTGYAMHSLGYPDNTPAVAADTNYNIIRAANQLSVTDFSYINGDIGLGRGFYNNYISSVVEAAKSYTGVKNLVVSKANNTISQVQDDTYYQSAAMSVSATPSDDLVSFDVSVSGVQSAFIVDEEGNRKTTFAPGSKFYVRVPTKDITNETGKVTVTVRGKFNNYLSGSYFTSENLQKVVVVTGTENYETANLVIDFVGTPDTGMSKSQTVFFIGLIVLLCGIGIIYANSKPVEVQS